MRKSGVMPPNRLRIDSSPIPHQQPTSSIDWDAVDSGNTGSINNTMFQHHAPGHGRNYNTTDDQFENVSPESAARRLDMDADSIRRMNNTGASEFANMTTRISAVSLHGPNQSMGAYFQARSHYPNGGGEERESMIRLQEAFNEQKPAPRGRGSLTTYFSGSESDGQSSEAMLAYVMKYCKASISNDQTQRTDQQHYASNNNLPEQPRNDVSGIGIMDITSISSIASMPGSPPHSTPKRSSGSGQNDFFGKKRLSLKDMRSSLMYRSGNHIADLKPKFSEAQTSTAAEAYRDKKLFKEEQDKDVTGNRTSNSNILLAKVPEKDERNASPNSSISSSATSASNAGSQCQLQIFTNNNHHPSSVMSMPPSNHVPIVIQVQCSCSNHGNHGPMQSNAGYSQASIQPQYYGPTPCHHQPQQQQVMTQMVPMMAMPVMMPVMQQTSCNHAQVQYQPAPNTQCQCRCASSFK